MQIPHGHAAVIEELSFIMSLGILGRRRKVRILKSEDLPFLNHLPWLRGITEGFFCAVRRTEAFYGAAALSDILVYLCSLSSILSEKAKILSVSHAQANTGGVWIWKRRKQS